MKEETEIERGDRQRQAESGKETERQTESQRGGGGGGGTERGVGGKERPHEACHKKYREQTRRFRDVSHKNNNNKQTKTESSRAGFTLPVRQTERHAATTLHAERGEGREPITKRGRGRGGGRLLNTNYEETSREQRGKGISTLAIIENT